MRLHLVVHDRRQLEPLALQIGRLHSVQEAGLGQFLDARRRIPGCTPGVPHRHLARRLVLALEPPRRLPYILRYGAQLFACLPIPARQQVHALYHRHLQPIR